MSNRKQEFTAGCFPCGLLMGGWSKPWRVMRQRSRSDLTLYLYAFSCQKFLNGCETLEVFRNHLIDINEYTVARFEGGDESRKIERIQQSLVEEILGCGKILARPEFSKYRDEFIHRFLCGVIR
jgi:hypothetical protein